MKFSRLASYFEKMEATTKRLELTSLLADLLKESDADEIDKIAYLTQGRLVPFFEPLEIGMAEKMVEQAICRAFDQDKEKVGALFIKLGDWGKVAYSLSERKSSDLSVTEVHARLFEIARTSGVGSVDKKISSLTELLKKVDQLSTTYLTRIPLGTMRLGIGDPTVLDALSNAKVGDKSLRVVLEEAYNKTSDLGLVAKVFWKGGIEQVKKVMVSVGFPIRPQLTERLPNPQSVIEKLGEVAAEPKYDGFRVQIHFDKNRNIGFMTTDGEVKETRVKIFSRNLEDMSHMFPELAEAALRDVKADRAILDGEAIAYNPLTGEFLPFQETTKRRRKHGIDKASKDLPLKAFIFDCIYLNDKELLTTTYRERRKIVGEIVQSEVLIPADQIVTTSPDELSSFLNDKISNGLEGVVVKKLDTPYQAGSRNFNWVKLKRHNSGELNDSIDCVLLGYIYGTGKRTDFGVGALLAGVYDKDKDEFVSICKIGTGLTDEEFREIRKRADKLAKKTKPARVNSLITPSVWLDPKIVIEVLADEITRSPVHTAGKEGEEPGYALRFPRLVSFRSDDKRPEDTTSVKEIVDMYKQQYKK